MKTEEVFECFDNMVSALEGIQQELQEVNHKLGHICQGQDVICVETGLDKGEPGGRASRGRFPMTPIESALTHSTSMLRVFLALNPELKIIGELEVGCE